MLLGFILFLETSFMIKIYGWGGVVEAHKILETAGSPNFLGLGLELVNYKYNSLMMLNMAALLHFTYPPARSPAPAG